VINVQNYYSKIANGVAISQDEIVYLLKEHQALLDGVSYLASCQAATLEGLPKSTAKSQRERHYHICLAASKILQGDFTDIRYKTRVEWALARCIDATKVQPHENDGRQQTSAPLREASGQ
jgi:hypothetical protein